MARFRELPLPQDLTFGFIPKYVLSRSFSLASLGKAIVITRQRSGPINPYLNKGMAIQVNSGIGLPQINDVPFDQRANFQLAGNGGFLATRSGKPVYQWDDSDYEAVASDIVTNRPVKIFTHSFSEADYNNPFAIFGRDISQYAQQNQQSYYKFNKLLGQKYRAIGGENFGDYAGACRLSNFNDNGLILDPDRMANIFSNTANAKQLAINNTTYLPQFFTTDLHQYMSVITQQYFNEAAKQMYPAERLIDGIASYMVLRDSLKDMGNTTSKVMSYHFSSNAEVGLNTTGYSEVTRRPMSIGGYVEEWDFPNWNFKSHLEAGLWSLVFNDVVYWFGNEATYSDNPDIIGADRYRNYDNFPEFKYYGDGNPTRSNPVSDGLTTPDYGYWQKAYGNDDAIPLAGEFYAKLVGWVGNQNWMFLPTIESGSGKIQVTGTKTALQQAYQHKGLFAMGIQANNRWSLLVRNFGPATSTFTITLGNTSVVVTVPPSVTLPGCVDTNLSDGLAN